MDLLTAFHILQQQQSAKSNPSTTQISLAAQTLHIAIQQVIKKARKNPSTAPLSPTEEDAASELFAALLHRSAGLCFVTLPDLLAYLKLCARDPLHKDAKHQKKYAQPAYSSEYNKEELDIEIQDLNTLTPEEEYQMRQEMEGYHELKEQFLNDFYNTLRSDAKEAAIQNLLELESLRNGEISIEELAKQRNLSINTLQQKHCRLRHGLHSFWEQWREGREKKYVHSMIEKWLIFLDAKPGKKYKKKIL